jgi:hypothetical protein
MGRAASRRPSGGADMFEFLKRTKTPATCPDAGVGPLYFKDGAAAFGYICKYMECPLGEGSALPALILDARELFGGAAAIKIQDDGNQAAAIRVASSDDGFLVFATTAGPKGPRLQPGQLVLWQAGSFAPALAKQSEDKRFGWVGLIVGTLRPEWKDGSWRGGERFST